jgi:hypothetical protein
VCYVFGTGLDKGYRKYHTIWIWYKWLKLKVRKKLINAFNIMKI